MNIIQLSLSKDQLQQQQFDRAEQLLSKLGADKFWLDIEFNSDEISETSTLLEELGCHPLAVQDALRKRHPPKLEIFSKQLFLLYRGIHRKKGSLDFDHQQIAFFITAKNLISVHPKTVMSIEQIKLNAQLSQLLAEPLELALTIIHTSAGFYLENLLAFESLLSDAEDALYEGPGEATLSNLAVYKARLIKLKRIFNYHLDLSRTLRELKEKRELPLKVNPHLLNDVYDRMERLHSLSQMHYDICADMIDSYISITSHQLNISMRILTVITAVFVPLSFLAGIYGMNFEYMPELKSSYGYFFLLAIMSSIATLSLYLFKKKGWF